ncbi:hypothetical protein J7I98_02545 [Streptomyces sp. ISL-98]|uniref:hypothetical protein n=1 Tax=Streptomyces sp. ISL-98 TaxID=2819192 RepID=UPI001BE63D07|nr:hypothetical protein [Streptomyces sp. ISL-98]MBT2504790.1 hypothetical protein [Streptomyces sp. ISL-98]
MSEDVTVWVSPNAVEGVKIRMALSREVINHLAGPDGDSPITLHGERLAEEGPDQLGIVSVELWRAAD